MMRHKMNQPGKSLGVIGLGGLGHLAVKFGKAFGLKVTILSTSPSKKEEALRLLGANNFVVSSDQEQMMKALAKSLDFIVDAASGDHPFDPYMSLLKTNGIMVLVGFPKEVKFSPASLNLGVRRHWNEYVLERTLGSVLSAISIHFFHYRVEREGIGYFLNAMPKPTPLSLQTVELKVRMCCTGCERVVKDAVYKIKGVDSVEVNLAMEKVIVIGYVNRDKVLKHIRRAGKRAEFWPYPEIPLYFTSSNDYFKDTTHEFKETYNYYKHGYNIGDRHGNIPITHRGDDKVSNLFNDDNVNACCLM